MMYNFGSLTVELTMIINMYQCIIIHTITKLRKMNKHWLFINLNDASIGAACASV